MDISIIFNIFAAWMPYNGYMAQNIYIITIMSKFRIDEPNKPTKWVKSVDNQNGTLEFSTTRSGCYERSGGIIADSEGQRLKFLFKEQYPEMEYLKVDNDW